MKGFQAVEHLASEETERRYKSCANPREKTHWQIVWLLRQPDGPRSAAQIARIVGYSSTWVRAIVGRWNQHGPEGLTDRRKDNGPADTLTTDQQVQLFAALQAEAPDGGLWTAPKLVRFVKDRWGIEVVPQTGWRWLRDLGFALKVPRPKHPKAATADQQRVWL